MLSVIDWKRNNGSCQSIENASNSITCLFSISTVSLHSIDLKSVTETSEMEATAKYWIYICYSYTCWAKCTSDATSMPRECSAFIIATCPLSMYTKSQQVFLIQHGVHIILKFMLTVFTDCDY